MAAFPSHNLLQVGDGENLCYIGTHPKPCRVLRKLYGNEDFALRVCNKAQKEKEPLKKEGLFKARLEKVEHTRKKEPNPLCSCGILLYRSNQFKLIRLDSVYGYHM